MPRYTTCFVCLSLFFVVTPVNAEIPEARLKQMLSRLDKDGNGTFEKQENPRQWTRFRDLDTNHDDVLTSKELSRYKSGYLETTGERKVDLVYKRLGKKQLALDLYYPTQDSSGPCPLVVYTHGGGWAAGSKRGAAVGSFAPTIKKLLEHGFCVASVDYRLYQKEGTVCMRDCVVDCKDAVRYLAKNSKQLGLDANRVFSFGDSAGGHLSQMLLLSEPESFSGDEALAGQSYTMIAGVSWYGPCDFEDSQLFNHDDRPDFRDRFGPRILPPDLDPSERLARYREMSPVNYLSKTSPPLLMIQGDKDTTIPVKHAYRIKKDADAIGAPVEILIIQNAGHNWRKVDADIEPTREEIVQRTVDFFLQHAQ